MKRAIPFVLLLFTASIAGADDPDPSKLVDQMGDKSYRVRQEATGQLFRLGEKAVPALKKGLEHAQLEVKTRCKALLDLREKLGKLKKLVEAGALSKTDYDKKRHELALPYLTPKEIIEHLEQAFVQAKALKKKGLTTQQDVEDKAFALLETRYKLGDITAKAYHTGRVGYFTKKHKRISDMFKRGMVSATTFRMAALDVLLARYEAGLMTQEKYHKLTRPILKLIADTYDALHSDGKMTQADYDLKMAALKRYLKN